MPNLGNHYDVMSWLHVSLLYTCARASAIQAAALPESKLYDRSLKLNPKRLQNNRHSIYVHGDKMSAVGYM